MLLVVRGAAGTSEIPLLLLSGLWLLTQGIALQNEEHDRHL